MAAILDYDYDGKFAYKSFWILDLVAAGKITAFCPSPSYATGEHVIS